MITDFSTKHLECSIFFEFRNKMQGIQVKDIDKYKRQYIEIFKQKDLYENDDDLFDI